MIKDFIVTIKWDSYHVLAIFAGICFVALLIYIIVDSVRVNRKKK